MNTSSEWGGMELKPGYKETEVGVIPEDWEVQKLGSIATFLDGMRRPVKSSDRARMKGSIPYYGASGVVDYVDDYIFDEELVLLGEDGENILSRNLPLAFRISGKTWVNNHAHVIRPNSGISIGFLTEYLDSLNYESLNSGTAQPKLNKQKCLQIPVALPESSDEQHAIATALSDADALLDGLDRLIAKKRDLKQAAMQQLLTGKTRLPGFDGEWEVKLMRDLLIYERPDHYIVTNTSYLVQGDIPVLTANKAFILGYTTENFGVCTDLPVIVFDDFTADSKLATVPFKVKSSAIKLLRPKNNRVSLKFLFELMQIIRFPVGEHKRHYISDYQNLELPIPEFDEQLAVDSILSDMDAEITALEARREKTKNLKQAMMQELLTGKTRLVTPGESNA